MRNNTKKALLAALGAALLLAGIAPWCAAWLPALAGRSVYIVSSGSMEPEYPEGCGVYVEQADPAGIEPGDVAAFRSGHGAVLHRVTENDAERKLLRTKGDANELPDAMAVGYGDVLGVAAGKMPYARLVAACTTGSGAGLTLFTAGAGAMVLVMAAAAPPARRTYGPKGDTGWKSAGSRARNAARR